MTGRVSFVGAGPGAADLITLRGANRIAEADIVVWAASLVDPECVREHARPEAELVDSSRITHEDALEIYRRAARERLKVARVHSGDPSLWGAVQEQYDSCQRLGLEVEIVPGVSAFSAAAAVAGRELTVPEVAQSLILTRLEGGKTPMPDGEHIREFARHGTTMAIFLSAARSGQLVDELRAGGYGDDTPVVVAYKVTWSDELILHTTLGELTETVKQHKLWRHTLFLVGHALKAGGTRSHLYNPGHFHTYRKADPAARRALRAGTSPPEPESHPRASAGWPLQSSRTGWVAARVSGDWSTPGQAEDTPAAERSASVAAWSAVHRWQQTARSAGRPGSRPRPARNGVVTGGQGAFALDDEVPPTLSAVPEPAPEPVVEPVAEETPAPEPKPVRNPPAKPKPAARKSAPKKTTAGKRSGGKSGRSGGGQGRPKE